MKQETIEIETNKGIFKIHWSNLDLLCRYSAAQNGRWGSTTDLENYELLHKRYFNSWHSMCWNQRQGMGAFDIPSGSKILDIGCGLSVVDLTLYSYIKDSKLYLLDRETPLSDEMKKMQSPEHSFKDDHPFYHSWGPVKDAIETSKFDNNRFVFLDPIDNFPEDLDLVLSSYSWCFHYPKEKYWDRAFHSLKTGGKLYLDVRLLPNRDTVGEISEAMKCKPTTRLIPKIKTNIDYYNNGDDNVSGYQCLWTKNI